MGTEKIKIEKSGIEKYNRKSKIGNLEIVEKRENVENMDDRIYDSVKKILGGDGVRRNEPMSAHCTFRTGGNAAIFAEPSGEGETARLISSLLEMGVPYFVVGRGSNLLVSDEGYGGVIISIGKRMSDIRTNGNRIYAAAGASLSAAAAEALANSLSGMEFASGIPGTVGGAVYMNAGAYGGEIKDIIVSARYIDTDGCIKEISAAELDFGYRHSVFCENGGIVTSAVFELKHADPSGIKARMAEFNARRREKQPLEYPSAGSTFKRPEGYFAGKLIQDAGLRGFSIGGAAVSDKHCGFVINKGGATSADIMALIEHIQKTVFEKSGVMLEPEVKILKN